MLQRGSPRGCKRYWQPMYKTIFPKKGFRIKFKYNTPLEVFKFRIYEKK